MSDFVKTMKDWRRMCAARIRLYGYDFCKGCSLENFRCPAIYNTEVDTDYSIVEREVSAWAAEHPVVYPTWVEWLKQQGIIQYDSRVALRNSDNSFYEALVCPTEDALKPIPADLAQKLGVEPKE